ncbi:bifunctional 3-demethylubiquinone 3-O-methyltransferase/2-octaprenyl-6-hydroxy phenol methylase [Dactylosporangium fulvum]|uniref:Methyltransferase domain-containing protein n=1 Tax=Dactylosporangium fulvum TaxID=53359 RepID=A0ABY5W2N8_9ACTN|nr:methyltransferase domain-containing protein [Dactylosporangium fulvum]UWP82993.1 methyltransferase domain-containing protein [Dactylosporangium fulvum]
MPAVRRARNDPGQYDDLAGEWWRPGSPLSMLYWLARARAHLIPPAEREGAVLVDLGCGGGLLAPHVAGKGYRHIGVDLIVSGLEQAEQHGVVPVLADAARLPFADGFADVVSAGELLEHVPDVPRVIAEACRILRPGGWLVLDTINDTLLARLVAVRLAEAVIPAVRGIHDPKLFVDPRRLQAECARHGVPLDVRGVRPALPALVRWLVTRRNAVPIVPTFSTVILYQGRGRKGNQ